jgi:hypothetical protein
MSVRQVALLILSAAASPLAAQTPTPTWTAGARIDVMPAQLDFGSVNRGETKDLTLTVLNSGTAVLNVTSASATNSRFSVVSPSLPLRINAGAQATMTVRFAPPSHGLQTGVLTLASDDASRASLDVALRGTGLVPVLIFSDSFEREGADACRIGEADLAFGGTGQWNYVPLFAYPIPGPLRPVGAGIDRGALENANNDYGGVQFSSMGGACWGEGTPVQPDLTIQMDVLVPGNSAAGYTSQAGPYLRAVPAPVGADIVTWGPLGYWIQLHSTGEVRVKRLGGGPMVAATDKPASFDDQVRHKLEVTAEGDTLQVALDDKLLTFTQQGARTTSIRLDRFPLSPTGAGILFAAEDNRFVIGGQKVDNLVVSTARSLAGLPAQE